MEHVDPTMSVAQAAEVLEQDLQREFGQDYERLYQSVALRLAELTRTEEQQFFSIVVFVGQVRDQLSLALALIWLARKQFPHSPLAQQFLDGVRAAPVGWLLQNARETVQTASEQTARKGDV